MDHNFYRAFEEKYRGSRDLIKSRLRVYLPFIMPLVGLNEDAKVVDLGCGRGEWLELLNEAGFQTYGVDVDAGMLAACHELGLNVELKDAIEVLQELPDASQVIVSGFHIVEHIPFAHLQTLVQEALRVLKPAGLLIFETPNPENIVVATNNFYIDPTHIRPIPLELLSFLPEYYGFNRVKILRLQEPSHLVTSQTLQLMDVLIGVSQDYAVVAQKTADAEIMSATSAAFKKDYGLNLENLAHRYHQIIANSMTRTEAVAKATEDRSKAAEAVAKAAEDRSKAAEAVAKQLAVEIQSIYSCRSWQMTKPLRLVGQKAKLLFPKCLISRIKAFGGRDESNQCCVPKTMSNQKIKTIAVDLTPILPGGENGGAKIFVLELLRRLSFFSPQTQFVLLTQAASHDELASMDCDNISRRMVVGPVVAPSTQSRLQALAKCVLPHLPGRIRAIASGLGHRLHTMVKKGGSSTLLRELGVDLLFCPFTAPTYFEPGVPTVCTIYDLQYKTYPEFFASEDVAHRDCVFWEASRRATAIAAISDYSRETAIRHANIAPERIRTIHLRMAQRIALQSIDSCDVLMRLGLVANRYLIYPANFWKHKNHEMLLTAFGVAVKAGLTPDIKLVCTGAPGERQRYLAQATRAMDLADRVVFPGYLPDKELAALLTNARGMLFPSLYEGFGLPIIEAMAAGVPVACSNTTSLPEVAANAAILFDPRVPTQIADAIITLTTDESIRGQLIEAGQQRAAEFADTDRMAHEYWDLFLYALTNKKYENLLTGVHADGWLDDAFTVHLAPSDVAQTLELQLAAPAWLPGATTQISVIQDGKSLDKTFELSRGTEDTIALPLNKGGERFFTFHITPSFVPAQLGISEDSRTLSLTIQRAELIGAEGACHTLYPVSTSAS